MLAYIVDANNGRSSSAVAANSFLRGVGGFVAAEVAIPLQVSLMCVRPYSEPSADSEYRTLLVTVDYTH